MIVVSIWAVSASGWLLPLPSSLAEAFLLRLCRLLFAFLVLAKSEVATSGELTALFDCSSDTVALIIGVDGAPTACRISDSLSLS